MQEQSLRKGDMCKTRWFGQYVESKDNALPVGEHVGTVRVHQLNGVYAAFLYETHGSDDYTRYDLPAWCIPWGNKKVVVLGRVVRKTVESKVYNKMIVIRIKEMPPAHDTH